MRTKSPQSPYLVLQTTKRHLSGKIKKAIETLKDGYEIGKWAFLGKAQVDSQIGVILYTQKKFGEAYKYLQKSNPRIFQAYCMLIVGHIKNKKIKEAKEAITLLIKLNKKEPFVYSFAGYIYANELKEKEWVKKKIINLSECYL